MTHKQWTVLVRIGSLLSFCASLAFLVGWLIPYYPTASIVTPIYFNTALCLFLLSCSLLLTNINRTIAAAFAVVVFIFVLTILSQYVFSINLGIDQFFAKVPDRYTVLFPGRISPNTGIAILIFAITLLLNLGLKNYKNKNIILFILILMPLSISAAAIFGYMLNIANTYSWAGFRQMSLTAAVLIFIFAMSFSASLWNDQNEKERLLFLPLGIGIFGSLFFILLWAAIIKNENLKINEFISSRNQYISAIYKNILSNYIDALNRMNERLMKNPNFTTNIWRLDATNDMHDMEALDGIAITNSVNHAVIAVQYENGMATHVLDHCIATAKTITANKINFSKLYPMYLCGVFKAGNVNKKLIYIINLKTIAAQLSNLVSVRNYNTLLQNMDHVVIYADYDPADLKLKSRWSNTTVTQYRDINFENITWPRARLINVLASNIMSASFVLGIVLSLTLALLSWLFGLGNINKKRLIESEETLRNTNQHLNAIMDNSPIAIIATNTQGVIEYMNHAAEEMLHYTEQELVGKFSPAVFHDKDEVKIRAEQLSKERRATVHADSLDVFVIDLDKVPVVKREWTFITKEGKRIPVMLSIVALKDADKRINGYLGMAFDITESKAIDQMKNEFISIVSHELRTPLTSIHGSLGLLLDENLYTLKQDEKDLLKIADNNCERLIRLINDILDIEKIDSGKVELHFKEQDISDLVTEAVSINQGFAEKFHIALNFTRPDKKYMVNVDHDRLIQVITNLISNAIKFASQNNGKVALSIDVLTNNRIRVNVTDNGLGIPKDFQDKIFKKFSQADSTISRKHSGTGLGLSISKAIIENHLGHIGFITKGNEGTTFYFELPYINYLNTNIHATAAEVLLPTILHIEDDPQLFTIMSSIFKNKYFLMNANNMAQAKEMIKDNKVELVILDLNLPDGHGEALVPILNQAHIPIVIFSAYDLPEHLQGKVEAILLKSKTSNMQLLATINTILASRRA